MGSMLQRQKRPKKTNRNPAALDPKFGPRISSLMELHVRQEVCGKDISEVSSLENALICEKHVPWR